MGILDLLRNAFGRRKTEPTETEAQAQESPETQDAAEQAPAREQAQTVPAARTGEAEPPAGARPEPAPEPEPATEPERATEPEPAAEPLPAQRGATDATLAEDLVAAAFDRAQEEATIPRPAEPVEEGAAEPVREAAEPEAVRGAAEAEPEAAQAVAPEAAQAVEPEAAQAVEPEPAQAVEPEPAQAVEPEPVPEPEARTVAPETAPEPTPASEPEPVAVAIPEPEPEATPEPVPAVTPAPVAEAAPEPATAEAGAAPLKAVPATPATRVKRLAPDLAPAYKSAGAALRKAGLAGTRARVYLVLDRSGSMRPYYKDGSAQALGEQVLALAAHLDTDAVVRLVFFSTAIDATGTLALDAYEGVVDRLHEDAGRMGRTNYALAIEEVRVLHAKEAAGEPGLVVFQTDGPPDARTAATQALKEAEAEQPELRWQFVSFGETDSKNFDYLRRLRAANAGWFAAGPVPKELTDAQVLGGVLADWHPQG
ncbi:VWA domain-containing protein [Streptomyces sp. P6-2-1]|uniref:VWA domain-containing protein n=1 Tax=Streptomyces sp. P6-2-1 TaxID=3422591 RepID=UPI003D366E14